MWVRLNISNLEVIVSSAIWTYRKLCTTPVDKATLSLLLSFQGRENVSRIFLSFLWPFWPFCGGASTIIARGLSKKAKIWPKILSTSLWSRGLSENKLYIIRLLIFSYSKGFQANQKMHFSMCMDAIQRKFANFDSGSWWENAMNFLC